MSKYTIHVGDCREVLATMPEQHFHCCVTSPPYFGLRDYGVSGQIGLEPTPDEFVAAMVDVFRGVWRVLRDDGVCWLNLGSSYASSNTSPNQSRQQQRVPSCDSDGIEPQDFPGTGRACPCCGGELQACSLSRRDHTDCTSQQSEQVVQRNQTKDRDSGNQDYEATSLGASSPAVVRSTTSSSSLSGLDASCLSGAALTDQTEQTTSSGGVRPSVHTDGNKNGTMTTLDQSVCHTTGMGFSCRACGYSTIKPLEFKPKDLIPIPWMVAFALQADGWYLRDAVIWHKPAPMPGSQRDRCTSSYEFIFQLTKKARYYFDLEAVKERGDTTAEQADSKWAARRELRGKGQQEGVYHDTKDAIPFGNFTGTRTPRNVWKIAHEGFNGAHFATFPRELPMRCIKASTSEKGCCPACGAPWVRVVEKKYNGGMDRKEPAGNRASGPMARLKSDGSSASQFEKTQMGFTESTTTGWAQTCTCEHNPDNPGPFNPAPCRVLDPFNGAGTTGIAACTLGRDYEGIELNPEYAQMARERIAVELNPSTARVDKDEPAPLFGATI